MDTDNRLRYVPLLFLLFQAFGPSLVCLVGFRSVSGLARFGTPCMTLDVMKEVGICYHDRQKHKLPLRDGLRLYAGKASSSQDEIDLTALTTTRNGPWLHALHTSSRLLGMSPGLGILSQAELPIDYQLFLFAANRHTANPQTQSS